MKIIVTGGSGFVGQHILDVCHERGHDALNIDRVMGSWNVLLAELNDGDAWEPALAAMRPDAIIHAAAHADVRSNWEPGQREAIFADNVLALLRVLNAAAETPSVKHFAFISTGAIYADRSITSPYAASKVAGEAYVQAYAAKCGWSTTIVRPAACVGPGYRHGHVADFVRQARENGRVHALDRGDQRRSMVHVRDVAERLVLAVEDSAGGRYAFSLCGGQWGWRDTVRAMGVLATWEDRATGWIGDASGPTMHVNCSRSIEAGIREALETLGWPSNETAVGSSPSDLSLPPHHAT